MVTNVITNTYGRLIYQFDAATNTVGVEMIEVSVRRQGHGTDLLRQALHNHPGACLTNVTPMTYDGEDFLEAFVLNEKVPAVLHFGTGSESFNL